MMKVRRQVYRDKDDNRKLEERSQATGLPVSALIRRAVHETVGGGSEIAGTEPANGELRESRAGAEIRPRLSWDERFERAKARQEQPSEESWVYDRLLDEELDREIDKAMDAAERRL
jgi:hypothetical protein